ncbi:Histidine kinase [Seminavis robusta]|uniref:Histidine kinase n=1 Tax=Seminavis robusta TaxID=568900 RepID=A0A9N8I114_9STRA|nr:Histidine kinase [Seminavis robusta]|eukprot:Sro3035_g342560.1 Histidine kinase (1014) ;mRNA; r:6427-9468
MKELCQQIQECEWMPLLMSRLLEQEEMGATVRILSRFLPQLNVMMVGEQHNPQQEQPQTMDDHQGGGGDENSFTGLKIAIRTFLLLVTSYQSVILVMDDLQWADEATLQVLAFVLQQEQPQENHPHQLFLVGCYRSNEVHKDHALEVALAQLDPQTYTRIPELPNLSLPDVHLLLCERLRMEEAQQLALIVHDKTHGNPFFVLQFLDAMMQRGILTRSILHHGCQWQWDCQRLQAEMDLADNVVGLVMQNMQRLDPGTQHFLHVAACLGNRFDTDIVRRALMSHANNQDLISISKAIRTATKEQLIEKVDRHLYRFSHDRIQQAAYQLVSVEDGVKGVEYHHYQLGVILKDLYYDHATNSSPVEWHLLVGTEQLNLGRQVLLQQQENLSKLDNTMELVHMNIQAARVVKTKSAFIPAVQFLRTAMDLLLLLEDREQSNNANTNLIIEVQLFHAEMELASGNATICKKLLDELLLSTSHGSVVMMSMEDQLEAYSLQIKACERENNHAESCKVARKALQLAGIKAPRFHTGPLKMFWCIAKLNHRLQKHSLDEIVEIPRTDSRFHGLVTDIVAHMSIAFHNLEQMPSFVVTIVLLAELCLRWGPTAASTAAFSVVGSVLVGIGAVERGIQVGRLGLDILNRWNFQESVAELTVAHGYFLMHLRRPLPEMIDVMKRGYQSGMASGRIFHGHICASCSLLIRFILAAHPLSLLAEHCKAITHEMVNYQSMLQYIGLMSLRQLIENLMTRDCPEGSPTATTISFCSRDKATLEGDVIPDFDEHEEKAQLEHGPPRRLTLLFYMMAAYLFGDLDRGRYFAEMLLQGESEFPMMPAMLYPFFRGMIFFDLVISGPRKKKRYYLRLAKKELAQLTQWKKAGFINIVSCQLLLEAKLLSVTTKPPKNLRAVSQAFNQAIVTSSRTGFSLFAAIAHESAADFLWQLDRVQAKLHVEKSLLLMKEWGAVGRVDFLMHKYNFHGETSKMDSFVSGTFLSRRNSLQIASRQHSGMNWIMKEQPEP